MRIGATSQYVTAEVNQDTGVASNPRRGGNNY